MKRRRWFSVRPTAPEQSAAEVEAELELHVAERVEQLVRLGRTPEEARAEAERRLGGLVAARRRLAEEAWERDRRLTLAEQLGELWQDVRLAARAATRDRGYAAVIIVTLALGIGANATMFGMVDRLLLSGPAHVEAPGDLRRFYINVQEDAGAEVNTWANLNYPVFAAFREGVPSVRDVSAYLTDSRVLGAGIEARQIRVGAVSASFFRMTGVRPVHGRFFSEAEDGGSAGEPVLVLSYELWQSHFGGHGDVLGETLELTGVPYTIVGIAPPGFTGVELSQVDGWVPVATALSRRLGTGWREDWRSNMVPIVGRLAPGATVERAASEATAALRAVYSDAGGRQALREARVTLAGIGAGPSGEQPLEARVSTWLVAVSAIVLLVACANVANLYFARALRRRREIAVRLALGISRRRLLRMLFLESAVLSVLGGAAALLVAYWGAAVVRNALLPDTVWTTSPLSVRVLMIAGLLTLGVLILTALAPALQSLNPRLAPALTGSVHAPPAPGRTRDVLAVLQAAFCVLLLVGAGLFVLSLSRVQSVDLGLDAERVLQLQLSWQTQPELTAEERSAHREQFHGAALERTARIPGVQAVAAAVGSPFHSSMAGYFRADGVDSIPELPGGGPYMTAVTPDYFATLGTPVLRGRAFLAGEGGGSETVAILSRRTAEVLWPGADPLGRCIYTEEDGPCARVVGVVADVRRHRIQEHAGTQFYVPLGQQPAWMGGPALLVRAAGDPQHLAEPVRRALFELEPALRYVRAATYREILDPQWRPWKLGATLFVICGLLALVIAAIGLYSVIAYLVLHRTHEIGVRMALGAERLGIVAMIVRQALVLAGAGVLIGLVIALAGVPYLEPLLFDTAPRDPVVMGVVALALIGAGLVAGAAPALRASRIPPSRALRTQ